jgi:PRD1 phage membrane DNA delivery
VGDKLITSVVSVLVAIVGVAIIAVLVSKNAQTPQVLTSAGTAFSGILKAAVSPVSGSGFQFSAGG